MIPFDSHAHFGKKSSHKGSHHEQLGTILGGFDFLPQNDLLFGAGISYSRSHLDWNHFSNHGKVDTVGGFVYGACLKAPLWLDATFGYFNGKIKGKRFISISSPIPFIAPFSGSYRHSNNSSIYLGHIGLTYDLYCTSCKCLNITTWPFANLDYVYAHQSKFREHGSTLALTVHDNHTQLLQPEIGIGCSFFFQNFYGGTLFSHSTLSYIHDIRFGGKKVKGFFTGSPDSGFEVSGLYLQNGAVCPGITLGIKTPNDVIKLQVAYEGAFGTHRSLNNVSAEFSICF